MREGLPETWVEAELKEVVSYKKGKKPSILKEEEFEDSVPYLDIKALEKGEVRQFADRKSSTLANSGSIAMVWDGARSGWVSKIKDGALGSTIAALTPKGIEVDYLYHFLRSKFDYLNSNTRGTGIPHIDPGVLWNIKIPIAPLAEQKRIVAKLDEAFKHLETLKAKLERIPELLKKFRQTVLTHAVTGKLTEEEMEGWETKTLGEVIIGKPKNGYSPKPVSYETKYRVLTLTATTFGSFNSSYFKFVDEAIASDSPFWVNKDDILIQRGNTIDYVGVSAIYDGPSNQFLYPDLMIRVRADEKRIRTKFLYYILSSKESRDYLRARATGTTGNMPKINQPTLVSLPVCYPSIEVQGKIIDMVEQLLMKAEAVESFYMQVKGIINMLPAAILTKTFRGEVLNSEVVRMDEYIN